MNKESQSGKSNVKGQAQRRKGRSSGKVFVAWAQETEPAAKVLLDRLSQSGLAPWMSSEILPGQSFRKEIRHRIRKANLVIAVFPKHPSYWLAAEAGLAYFEDKLLPVAIDDEAVVEPFSELQMHILRSTDIAAGGGPSVDSLLDLVRSRLGYSPESPWLVALCRIYNGMFFYGVPILGAVLVGTLLIAALLSHSDPTLEYWRAGHIVLGAVVFGGAAFIVLVFSRATTSPSLAERQFGFSSGKRLFCIWLIIASFQFFVGIVLLRLSESYSITDKWVLLAVFAYVFALFFFGAGFLSHQTAGSVEEEERSRGMADMYAFLGNSGFGLGLILLTAVIVFMGLKHEAGTLLSF